MNTAPKTKKQENMLHSLIFNIALPSFILMKASKEAYLGPQLALVVALAFPAIYMIYDFRKRGDYSLVSILGFINVLLTGGLGLMKVEGIWFAVKEAAVPGVIGLACLASLKREKPLTYALLFNEAVFNIARVNEELNSSDKKAGFNSIMKSTTVLLALSFFLSSILNFILAFILIKSPSGTEAFNEELAKMQLMSYPVIVIPSMLMMGFAFYKLFSGIKNLTGLTLEDIVHQKK